MKKIIITVMAMFMTIVLTVGTINAQPENKQWNNNHNNWNNNWNNNNWNNNWNNNNHNWNWNNYWNNNAPQNCKVWYDGCNTCTRQHRGGQLTCTKLACFSKGQSYCKQYFRTSHNNNWYGWGWNNHWNNNWWR